MMLTYRLEQLRKDVRKAMSLPPKEVFRRFAGRAARYARRWRHRHKAGAMSEREFLTMLSTPTTSLEAVGRARSSATPLVPASLDCGKLVSILKERSPESLDPILRSAREVRRGSFDLLGSGRVDLGPTPDWQKDFKSGKRWDERAYSLDIVQTPDRGHDIKVPWELARLQHLPTLGIASAITGDPGFRQAAWSHITSFLSANPPYRGVNWNCTMDVAIRAAQILSSEGYLAPAGEAGLRGELLRAMTDHARFIRENLEDGPVRGNHYLSDLAGLYLCALGLGEVTEAAAWKQFARDALHSEMERQVRPDGFDFEASTSYHALATEMLLFPALLGTGRGDPFGREYLDLLEKMVEVISALIRSDGTLPQIGDNDDGRFLIFSQYHRSRRDWRPLLALASFLFRNEDWLAQSGDAWVEGVWVLGEPFVRWIDTLRVPLSHRPFSCAAFPHAGVYQLGFGSTQMVVDAGDVGQGNNGGHAHNDTLAFELHAFGREVLPDRGTGTYTPSLELRNRFRSTRSHNTVQVDGEEINPFPEEPFRLIPADEPRVRRWRAGSRWAYFEAEHHGYRRLPLPVVHRRRFLLSAREGSFAVEERFEGRGEHRFLASFHLAPGWDAREEPGGWIARPQKGEVGLRFRWILPPAQPRTEVTEDRHSPSYGVTVPAKTVRLRWEGAVPQQVRYRLIPFLGERP
jgi:uncharacterized heparinase superfamily protein